MKSAKWRSRDTHLASNIATDGIAALCIIPLIDRVPYNFGLKLLSFIVLMIAISLLVGLTIDHILPEIESMPASEDDLKNATPTAPIAAENMPPQPAQKPSIGINEVKSIQEYRERRHRKRMFKEAWGAVLGLESLLIGLVTSITFQALGSSGLATIMETNWVLTVVFIVIWVCYGWLAFETWVRKKIEPSDGKHPPHRFSRVLSGGSYLVSVAWVIWSYLSINNGVTGDSERANVPIVIGIVGSVMTIADCLTLYREYWWYQRHWLIVSGYRVYMTYPKNKWLGFRGGEPEINVWQVENRNDLGQTLFEQWLFKDSSTFLINGPGEEDKPYFGRMTDVLHVSKLKETIENNREAYYKRHRLFNHIDD
jgi:hypothetical protein